MESTEPITRLADRDGRLESANKVRPRISKHTQWNIYIAALVVSDLLMMGLGFRMAYFIRFELSIPIFQIDVIPNFLQYQRITFLAAFLWLIVFIWTGLYNKEYLLGGPQEYALVFRASTTAMLIVIIADFLQPFFIVARGWLILAWGLSFFWVSVGRFVLRRVVYFSRRFGLFITRCVIVGANSEGILLANQLADPQYSGLEIVGFVDKKFLPDTVPTKGLRVLGNMSYIDSIVKDYNIEEIILASSSITSRDKLLEIFQKYGMSEDISVRMSSGLYEIITTGLRVREYAYVPLVCVNKVRLTGVDSLLKMVLDFGLGIPILIASLPIMAVIAILIRLDSPGPIIHRRRVMGVNNRQFDAFKFRTMYVNGDEILAQSKELQQELAEKHKLKNDPRVTRVGRVLRKLSLDELPQIFNVLRFEMSLVGPRMISPEEMKEYNQWGMNLLTVRPGITGLWQVSGRSDLSYAERVRLDMHYIRNWSIWLDLQLLIQTIPAVLRRRGAY
ncbi:MAG: sugar transferase [Anaerolineales bacterium]|jgi:exopolysaccharide biosynthesis polyprenyl glycosylphosphotransferase|nr:sugar transferase [Anaerolineales bacterium]